MKRSRVSLLFYCCMLVCSLSIACTRGSNQDQGSSPESSTRSYIKALNSGISIKELYSFVSWEAFYGRLKAEQGWEFSQRFPSVKEFKEYLIGAIGSPRSVLRDEMARALKKEPNLSDYFRRYFSAQEMTLGKSINELLRKPQFQVIEIQKSKVVGNLARVTVIGKVPGESEAESRNYYLEKYEGSWFQVLDSELERLKAFIGLSYVLINRRTSVPFSQDAMDQLNSDF